MHIQSAVVLYTFNYEKKVHLGHAWFCINQIYHSLNTHSPKICNNGSNIFQFFVSEFFFFFYKLKQKISKKKIMMKNTTETKKKSSFYSKLNGYSLLYGLIKSPSRSMEFESQQTFKLDHSTNLKLNSITKCVYSPAIA